MDKVLIYRVPFFYFYSNIELKIEENGYIEVPPIWEVDLNYLLETCNWSCFPNETKPRELHSDVEYCKHDIIFYYKGVYYINYINSFFIQVKGGIKELEQKLKTLDKVVGYKR